LGRAAAAGVLMAYGLSALTAAVVMELAAPSRLPFVRALVGRARLREAAGFTLPEVLTTLVFSLWMTSDVLVVRQALPPVAVGQYGVAKALVFAFSLLPSGVVQVLLPTLARRQGGEWRYLGPTLAAVSLGSAALLAILMLAGQRIILVLFGAPYAPAHAALTALAPGMALHALFIVLQATWLGRGRPIGSTLAMLAGLAVSLPLELGLVSSLGIRGVALGFAAGGLAQVLTLGLATLWFVRPTANR
jgi:O-antigen/teichoic acid export membrane protein